MAKQPPVAAEPAEIAAPTATPKPRKKMLVVAAGALVALVAAGAGAWFFMGSKTEGAEAHAAEAKPAKPEGPPLFLPLEAFVVNLQPANSEQFLQADITLRVADQAVADQVKAHMPEVRDRVLRLLATKNAQELAAAGGREKLAEDVRVEITRIVDPDAIKPPPAPKLVKEPAADVETDAAAEEPAAETLDEEQGAEAEEDAAPENKVRSVLFTSFIIQ